MKRHRLIPILVFLPLLLLATIGCQKEEKQLIGTWYCTQNNGSYTITNLLSLNNNDTFTWITSYSTPNTSKDETITGTYLFDSNNSKIYFTSVTDNSTFSYIISIIDEKLILSEYQNESEDRRISNDVYIHNRSFSYHLLSIQYRSEHRRISTDMNFQPSCRISILR